ncbi:MAG: serine/threonine-protein kinase PknK, partial [Cyanobacteria bacterium P01_F01_bin.116]
MRTSVGMTIPGYLHLVKLYESSKTLVYRGVQGEDGQRIVIKILRKAYPTPTEIARYQQEYDITCNLNGNEIIKIYGVERYQNTVFLVLEDIGGESLKSLLSETSFSVLEGLELAIATISGLTTLHQANIIHKDINPANIVVNQATQQLKIIDYGISTALPEAIIPTARPEHLEGTLPYLAPEQTGRMNRPIDYRADFYGLGATLYQLFTGVPPFTEQDALALVHAHLAKPVVTPQAISPDLPQSIANILLKLLAKNPEDRYQSVRGIQADLQSCHDQLATTGKILTFPLAQEDHINRLQISKQLYGRQLEIHRLQTNFEELMRRSPGPRITLITGAAGVGKSALIQELHKPLTHHDGYFISGKFEQLERGTPYFAVLQALQQLVEQLLTLDEDQLKFWQQQFQNALADNLGVMAAALPGFALLLDSDVIPAPPLKPQETKRRFYRVVNQFLEIFLQSGNPLVLCLDDLHWADGESLQLINYLINSQHSARLFLIGSYRDQEVSVTHPLMRLLESLDRQEIAIDSIHLLPLGIQAVQNLLVDTLGQPVSKALVQLIINKTEGNPFFINEFLKVLVSDGALCQREESSDWSWNLEKIQQRESTENVVDLLTTRCQTLTQISQKLLQLGACLGSAFTLESLSTIAEESALSVAQQLHSAILTGLIAPLDHDYRGYPTVQTLMPGLGYRFTHDRIQQAAYGLRPVRDRSEIHWQIGQHLLKQVSTDIQNDSNEIRQHKLLFEIIDHLNLGAVYAHALSLELSTKTAWRDLNLFAGQRAQQAAAFSNALAYLLTAIELLDPESWQDDYNAALFIYQEAAEAAYANSDYGQLERLSEGIIQQAVNTLDTVPAYELLLKMRLGQNRPIDAIQLGLEVLKKLGIHLPQEPSEDDIVSAAVAVQAALNGREIAMLEDLPPMKEPKMLAAIQIIEKLFTPAYFAKPLLMPIVTFEQVRLSLTYGNASLSPVSYASYGIILCSQLEHIDAGYAFGELALKLLVQKSASKSIQANTLQKVVGFTKHFKEPIRNNLPRLLEAYQLGLDSGSLQSSAHSASMYALHAYVAGIPLAEVSRDCGVYSQTLQQLQQEADLDFIHIYHQGILNLMGEVQNPCLLIGDVYDETVMLPKHQQTGNRSSMFLTYAEKSLLCYTFQAFEEALAYSDQAKDYLASVTGSMNTGWFYFTDSLIRLAVCDTVQNSHDDLLQQVEANQAILIIWADHAPANYLNWCTLVDAEYRRIVKDPLGALNSYEQAIKLSQQHGFIQDEALANELAGQFHLGEGRVVMAEAYLRNARHCYLRWGALAKVKELDQRFPQLLAMDSRRSLSEKHSDTTQGDNLPLLDVVTLLKSTQALAAEIVPEKLLATLMEIVLENAGAQRGVLATPQDES